PWADESESKLAPMIMSEPDPDTACEWLVDTGASLLLCGHYHVDEEEAELGDGLLQGFCAGTAGGVDDPDDFRRYHVLRLGKNGRVKIKDYPFEIGELDEMVEDL
ncbi:MAG: hypothetical protein KAI66_26095, partial [Lentisphaeria bacterium]|nr:hypothetical protein [Lentisphaeria bacterium]